MIEVKKRQQREKKALAFVAAENRIEKHLSTGGGVVDQVHDLSFSRNPLVHRVAATIIASEKASLTATWAWINWQYY